MSGHITVFQFCVLAAYGIHGIKMCNPGQYKCHDGQCIDGSLRCNNGFDCVDASDEVNCTTTDKCREGLYRCLNGECIDTSKKKCNDITTEQPYSHTDITTIKTGITPNEDNDGTGIIVVAVIVPVIVVIIIICAVFYLRNKRKH